MTSPEPLNAPDSASLHAALARDYAVQINTAAAGSPPTWVFVMGLNKVSPTTDTTMQDDGDIHSNGRKSQIATAIGENLELGGLRKGSRTPNFVPDPGIERLRYHGSKIGYENIAHIRYWRTDEIDEAKEGYYAVNFSGGGEDKEGLLSWTATLTGRGQAQDIEKPREATKVTITLPGSLTGGDWTLDVDDETTAAIVYNAAASAVKSALEALPNVGAGNATVTGVAGGPYTVTVPGTVTITGNGYGLTPAGPINVAPAA